jgi:hypothetical protein
MNQTKRAPILFLSVVLTFGLAVESIKEFGGASRMDYHSKGQSKQWKTKSRSTQERLLRTIRSPRNAGPLCKTIPMPIVRLAPSTRYLENGIGLSHGI